MESVKGASSEPCFNCVCECLDLSVEERASDPFAPPARLLVFLTASLYEIGVVDVLVVDPLAMEAVDVSIVDAEVVLEAEFGYSTGNDPLNAN